MKFKRLMVVAGLMAVGTAVAGGGAHARVLFNFEGGVGNQVFRSAAGAPALNTVAGVPPGGAPWGLTSFQGSLKTSGDLRARGTGVLLWGADGIGTRAGPRQVIVSVFCRNVPVPPAVSGALILTPFNSAPVDLDEDGDFEVRGPLTDDTGATPPHNCGDTVDNRPVLLIRAVTPANPTTGTPATPGAWFAAGFVKGRDKGGRDRDWYRGY
jgi:hypothetical protein